MGIESLLARNACVVIPSAGSADRNVIRALTAEAGTVSVCMHTGPTEPKVSTDFDELTSTSASTTSLLFLIEAYTKNILLLEAIDCR